MKVVASIADSKGLAQDCVVCVWVWVWCQWCLTRTIHVLSRPCLLWVGQVFCLARSAGCPFLFLTSSFAHGKVSYRGDLLLATLETGPHLAGLKNIYGQNGQSEVCFFYKKEVVGRQVEKRRGSRRRRKPCKLQNTLHLRSNGKFFTWYIGLS